MSMFTLGIETSCDETSASVLNGHRVLSNIVTSSVHLHKRFGGVVPEIACRYHVEYISYVIEKALKKAGIGLPEIKLISVTQGPGLVGALLVGISMAKSLSFALDIPVVGVNHLHAHIWSAILSERIRPPFMGLVVSGGHTCLAKVQAADRFKLIGQTRDDAAGEALDKAAKILGLGYPGGPAIEKMARSGNLKKIKFPKARLGEDNFDFSFSGIKTAVLYFVREREKSASLKRKIKTSDIAAAFQESIVESVVGNTIRACRQKKLNKLVAGGGVIANKRLRERLSTECNSNRIKVYFPPRELCVDNAAIVAGLGRELFKKRKYSDLSMTAVPDLKIGN